MRTTGGTCIHCSEYVERNQDGVLVSREPGAPDLAHCGATDLTHQVDEDEDECDHPEHRQFINDRNQFACGLCGEELGR